MNELIDFWAAALAMSLLLYVLLDGFDLGVGMLFAIAPNELSRRHMMQSISPVWDGNETWLMAAAAYALGMQLRVLHRWVERPAMLALPLLGLVACAGLVMAIRRRVDWLPLLMTGLIFLAAFATLAGSFLPYMVPFSITIDQGASPESSLSFMFWGAGIIVLPITVIYTLVVYWVFKGKVQLPDYS